MVLARRSRTESRTSNSTRRDEKLSDLGIERRYLTFWVVHAFPPFSVIRPEAFSWDELPPGPRKIIFPEANRPKSHFAGGKFLLSIWREQPYL